MKVPPCRRALVRRHCEVLALSAIVVLFAFLLRVRSDDRVVFQALPDHPLPPTCMSQTLLNVKCPGCGLTRSIVDFAHGDLQASWQQHRLGWLLGAVIVLQFPYRYLALRKNGRHPFGARLPAIVGWVLIGLLVGNWLAYVVGF